MLERAVAELKGEVKQAEQRVTINLGVDLRIPPEYIPTRESAVEHVQENRGNPAPIRNAKN